MTLRVKRTDHFALPIFRSEPLPGFAEHQQGLVDVALRLRAQGPNLAVSNQRGFHSQANLHTLDDPHIAWLLEQVHGALETAQGSVPRGANQGEPRLRAMWANVHEAGGYNAPHAHPPNHWSGVFYVLAEGARVGLPRTELDGAICFHNPYQPTSIYGSASTVKFFPPDGALVLFPGFLLHTVLPHRSQRLRISIAFNADIRGR